MNLKRTISLTLSLACFLCFFNVVEAESKIDEKGFVCIFNGKDFSQWRIKNDGKITANSKIAYKIKDGAIVTGGQGEKNIYTEKAYEDYTLRFEFKFTQHGNNGLGLRAPNDGSDVAYSNFKCQILNSPGWKEDNIKNWQKHGSVYGVIPAKTNALKKTGEWNTEEITFKGTHLKITVNGKVIIDHDLATTKPKDNYAKGLLRARGYICLAGHGPGVSFRKFRIKEHKVDYAKTSTKDNTAPKGFRALFDGKSFDNWYGLPKGGLDNPYKRAKVDKATLEKAIAAAEERRKKNWSVEDNALAFNGRGFSLATKEKFENYELYVDYKILKNGDSGLYLHGTPQVQIWDPSNENAHRHGADKGSGGLWNNNSKIGKRGKFPLVKADNPIGEWNTFFIRMNRGMVTIYLNEKLIVNNVPLDNYWNRGEPLLEKEQIELQAHDHKVWFKNIYIREVTHKKHVK